MSITPSFKKSLIVEQFQENYLKWAGILKYLIRELIMLENEAMTMNFGH